MAFTCSIKRESLGAYTKQKTDTNHEHSNKLISLQHSSKHIQNHQQQIKKTISSCIRPDHEMHVDQTFRGNIQSAILSRATKHQNHLKSDMDLSLWAIAYPSKQRNQKHHSKTNSGLGGVWCHLKVFNTYRFKGHVPKLSLVFLQLGRNMCNWVMHWE